MSDIFTDVMTCCIKKIITKLIYCYKYNQIIRVMIKFKTIQSLKKNKRENDKNSRKQFCCCSFIRENLLQLWNFTVNEFPHSASQGTSVIVECFAKSQVSVCVCECSAKVDTL